MKMKDGHCIPDCDVKNCAKCNGDETCRYCKSVLTPYGGYEPAPNGTEPCPFVCDPVELNCLLTNKMKRGEVEACFALGCKFCPPHTFRKNHKCVKCAEGCDICLNEKECTRCLPGYSYYMGQCFKCNENGTCGEGEYMDSCECKSCKDKFPNCAACDKDQCIVCKPRFTLAPNKTACIPCIGKNCLKPHHPEPEDPECPTPCTETNPCPDPDIPIIPNKTCELPPNITISNGEAHFDPACAVIGNDCYCVECKCGYKIGGHNHTCIPIPEDEREPVECPEGEKWNGCACIKVCECGEKEDGTCVEKPQAIDGCTVVNCKHECEGCECHYFRNGTICSPCPENSTLSECNRPLKECPLPTPPGNITNECPCHQYSNGLNCTICEVNSTNPECNRPECPDPEKCDIHDPKCCNKDEYFNETDLICHKCECPECVYFENGTKCLVCEDGTIPLDGSCIRALSLARSSTIGVSVVVAIVMIIAVLIWI